LFCINYGIFYIVFIDLAEDCHAGLRPGIFLYYNFALFFLICIMTRSGSYSVYILSNFARTVFYIGVTNNLQTRIREHRNNEGGAFTSKYKCHYLMYYEDYADIRNAIAREKQLKNWLRKWKIELMRKDNPDLIDLAKDWI